MFDIINMQALIEDYRRQTNSRRITSGERRVLSLRKEEERLNRQKP